MYVSTPAIHIKCRMDITFITEPERERANRGGAGQGGQGQRHHPPVEHSFSGSVSIFVYELLAKERFDFKSIF